MPPEAYKKASSPIQICSLGLILGSIVLGAAVGMTMFLINMESQVLLVLSLTLREIDFVPAEAKRKGAISLVVTFAIPVIVHS